MRSLTPSSFRQISAALMALAALSLTFWVYVSLEKRIDAVTDRRQASEQLVDQLRHGADELTRMARSYVLTREPRYRQAYQEIHEIREGRRPWTDDLETRYWELLLTGRSSAAPTGGPTMLERLQAAGFTSSELSLLAQARAQAESLTRTERLAMEMPAGPDAQALLYSPGYMQGKAALMATMRQVQASVRVRTAQEVGQAVMRADAARAIFVLLAVGAAILLLRAQARLRRLLGGSVDEVHARITQIGKGDFNAPLPELDVTESSVLGRLAQTQRQLQQLDAERSQALQRLQLAAGVFTHAREGIMITDAAGLIVDVNEAFTRLTGYERTELVGHSPRLLDSGRHGAEYYERMMSDLRNQDQWQGEIWDRRKCGELFASLETISAVRDVQGEITHYISLMTDITAIKEQAQRLEHIAHYDALTALPNRVLLGDRLKHAMAMAPRHGSRIALVYLDLDGFKEVNDQHGHDAGDHLLVELATRLRQVLREGDTLARLGGDEFVIVLLDLPDEATCHALLTRMLREIAQPFMLEGEEVQVSGSLGVAYYPQQQDVDADQLLRQADQAMYAAKLAGKNRYMVFDVEQAAQLRGQLETVEGIRLALEQRQFVLHYQPKVHLRSGQVVGAEALLRWQHPERGLLTPSQFLPVIEDHPLESDVGDWVIEAALQQMADWRAQGLSLPLSVNVSARQLQRTDFVGRVLSALQRHAGLQPQDLMLEVLETSALEDLVHVSRTMAEGKARGLLFSLDDFGTGYSSLTYLRRLPVAQLKIDQSFVRDMLDDADDLAILDGVIGLAAAFRREVIAEGVESVEHGAVLLQLGCELAQGHGIAHAMPALDLPVWMARWRPPVEWQGLGMVSRENLPLLRASIDHRARSRALRRHLLGQREQAPSLDPRDSRLAEWLSGAQGAPPRHDRLRHCHVEWLQQGQRLLQLMRGRGAALEAAMLTGLDAAELELQQALRPLLLPGH